MTNSDEQIRILYDEQGASVTQIAEAFGYGETEVKLSLAQYSQLYNERLKESRELGNEEAFVGQTDKFEVVKDEEFAQIRESLKNLALYGENEGVRAKLLRYLVDEKKGRNDLKAMKGLQINVNQFNIQMQRARAALAKGKSAALVRDSIPSDAPALVPAGDIVI